MLVIGCGNMQRGDDGAGVLAALQLSSQGIHAEVSDADIADLLELWRGAQDVILIDAVVTGAPVGRIHVWDARTHVGASTPPGSTHGLGVREAVEIARTMSCLPPQLHIYGIEGSNFAIGSELSPEVQGAITEVVQRIASLSAAG